MKIGMFSSDGDVMAPFICVNGLRPNIETYIKYFAEVALTWIKKVAAGRSTA